MSADRQRLTSAIRRIAKTDPAIRDLLKAADNKGGKPGAAGVGGGPANEEGANTSNETRICCDGSVGEPNPGVDERNPDDGGQTGLDPDDPADTDQGPGTLDGVTDCATGEPICFDGDGFIPPDGWDAPNDPPVEPTWVLGKYGAVESYSGGTENITIEYYASYEIAIGIVDAWCRDFLDSPPSGEITSCGNVNEGKTAVEILCDDRYDPAYCDADNPPLAESWPADGCANLAIKNGTIVGSKYDPENDGSYSAPRTSIDLCDGSGNQISLAPAANGGWKTINSITNNGYLYDSSGKQIAHIDGNEYSDPSV